MDLAPVVTLCCCVRSPPVRFGLCGMQMSINSKQHLSISQAAAELGVSADSLRRWSNAGKLPQNAMIVTGGGHRRFRVALVLEWMSEKADVLTRRSRRE